MSNQNSCCVTGHRDLPIEKIADIQSALRLEIMSAIADGYTHFISGFAGGTDLLFAEIVIGLQDEGHPITLEAAIPYRNRLKSTDPSFQICLNRCNVVGVISENYSRDCYMTRNRTMVQNASRVIAVYDGREKGGTDFTIRYSKVMERDLKIIRV